MNGIVLTLLSAATAQVDGAWQHVANKLIVATPPEATYQAVVAGDGAVSATVVIEGSNDGENGVPIATITLSGTDLDSDGFAAVAAWPFVRARVTAISGTEAAVTVTRAS